MGPGAALLLVGAAAVAGGSVPAHVQSQYGDQLVTSSTLSWAPAGAGRAAPGGAVSAGTGRGLVCRGSRHGVSVVGATNRLGRCEVVLNSRPELLTEYQVLRQEPGASRLEWRSFSRFGQVPAGAVAGVEGDEARLVARRLGPGGEMRPAVLERQGGGLPLRRILVHGTHGQVTEEQECDLLVEVEPVRYELVVDPYTKAPARVSVETVLATTSIFRFAEGRPQEARMQKMVSYDYRKSSYLGTIPATIRGLPARVELPSGERRQVQWGLPEATSQREAVLVGRDMRRNTAVDVSVTADSVTEEQPLAGTLTAVFPDGSRRERRVEAALQTRFLDNIRPEYSAIYAIREQVVVASSTERPAPATERGEVHYRQERLQGPGAGGAVGAGGAMPGLGPMALILGLAMAL